MWHHMMAYGGIWSQFSIFTDFAIARLAADLPLRCEFSCLESSKHRLCKLSGLGTAFAKRFGKCVPCKR